MDSRVVVTVVMGIAASIVFLAFYWYPAHKEKKYSNPTICANILACKGYGIANPKNLHTPLESRAIPNETPCSGIWYRQCFHYKRRYMAQGIQQGGRKENKHDRG